MPKHVEPGKWLGLCVWWIVAAAIEVIGAAPANDHFAQAELMPPVPSVVAGSTVGSTVESGEVNAGSPPFNSVWYKWIPAESGGWEISFGQNRTGDSLLIFTGANFATFRQVGFVSPPQSNSLTVQGGVTYYLRVSTGQAGGNTFSLRFVPGPAHDLFAKRLVLEATSAGGQADFEGAGIEEGEPDYGPMQGRSLWWRWVAPATGGYSISTGNVEPIEIVSLFQGETLETLTKVPVNRVWASNSWLEVFRAVGGQEYALRLTWYGDKRSMPFSLTRSPANDEFEQAEKLGPPDTSAVGDISMATFQPGELVPPPGVGGTLWYWWEVPATGGYVARSSAAIGVARVRVFRGESLASLVSIQQAAASHHPTGEGILPFRAAAGERIYVAVDPAGSIAGPFSVGIYAPRPNDDFANAELIPGIFEWTQPAAFLATVQPGEPVEPGFNNAGSLWWRWKAPATGSYLVESRHPQKVLALGVYSGSGLESLVTHASQTNRAVGLFVAFSAEANREYLIRLAQDAGGSSPVELQVRPGLENDTFATADLVSFLPYTWHRGFRAASMEAGEPFTSAASDKGTLWWKWVVPVTGSYQVSAGSMVEGSALELAILAGVDRENLQLLRKTGPSAGSTRMTVQVTQGETIYFAVAEKPNFEAEDRLLTLTVIPGPPNDNFANAQLVEGRTIRVPGTLAGASRELGEPNHRGSDLGASVWFKWVPTFTARVAARTSGTGAHLRVFQGSALDDLQEIETFPTGYYWVVEGKQYYFVVDAPPDAVENIFLSLGLPPLNDLYAQRQVIETLGVKYRSATVFAGIEPSEPSTSGPSIWWSWTAPEDGVLTATMEAVGTKGNVEIYYREPLLGEPKYSPTSWLLASSTNQAAVMRGETYDLRVTTVQASADVGLTLGFTPGAANETWSERDLFRGGTALWRVVTQAAKVHSPPNALEAPSLPFPGNSWIQKEIRGPGRVSFWAKRGTGANARIGFQIVPLPGQQGQTIPSVVSGSSWTRVSVLLTNELNLVRWTASGTELPNYLDDIEFIPFSLALAAPVLRADGTIALNLNVDYAAGPATFRFETSTDLRTWVPWTNVMIGRYESEPYSISVVLPKVEGQPQGFYRVVK